MPIPLAVVAAVAGIAASGAAVVTCGVGVVRTVKGYNLDPRIAVQKNQKDVREMQHHQAQIEKNRADYDAGKMSQRTFEYWDGLHKRMLARRYQKIQDRAAMYQSPAMPKEADEMLKETGLSIAL